MRKEFREEGKMQSTDVAACKAAIKQLYMLSPHDDLYNQGIDDGDFQKSIENDFTEETIKQAKKELGYR